MNVNKSESGSDLSSDSSWTVIEEVQETFISNTNANTKPGRNLGIELIKTTEVVTLSDVPASKDNDFVKVTFSNSSIKQSSDEDSENSKQETKENGFLTFDEYLQERMLEHDYEYPNQSVLRKKLNKSKKFPRNRSKCKAETIGVLSLCASLLTVTGIALLCLIFPENIDSKNFDTIKSNVQAISNNDSLDYNNIVASFNKTMGVLEAANNSKLLAKCGDTVMKNSDYRYKPFRRTVGPMNEIATSRYRLNRRQRNSMSSSNLFKNDVCYPKSNNGVCYASEDPRLLPGSKKQRNKNVDLIKLIEGDKRKNSTESNNQTTALTAIESVFAGTDLKKIIRSIIHDICILKLITYLNKNKEPQETKKKSTKGEQKASKRKIYEAIADGLEQISFEDIKDRRIKTAKRKNKTRKQILKRKEGSIKSTPSFTPPPTRGRPKPNFLLQYSRQRTSFPLKTELIPKFENGKSECERRFEELDSHRKKSQEVCSKHKLNIQQIKQQYRNEIDAIKDSNIEPMVRLQKIQTLREKYKFQLKKNREMYVREMTKMKRMRTKMLKDLCTQKNVDLEMKDVAVGSYVVPIEEDFYSRLQKIKDKEISSFNFNEKGIQDSSKKEKTEPIFKLPTPLKYNYDISKFRFQSQPFFKEYKENERINNDLECVESKRQCIKSTPIIPSTSRINFDFDSKEPECNLLDLGGSLDENVCLENRKNEESLAKSSDDSQIVELGRSVERKKNQGRLYQMVFDKKGAIIENSDKTKWQQKKAEHWEKYRKDLSKHDPQKCSKPNILLYKF